MDRWTAACFTLLSLYPYYCPTVHSSYLTIITYYGDEEVLSIPNSDTCPGIKKFVRPVPAYFSCPECDGQVEIWSDEEVGVCDTCNKEFGRPEKEQSCLDWCEYADKCREIIKNAQTGSS